MKFSKIKESTQVGALKKSDNLIKAYKLTKTYIFLSKKLANKALFASFMTKSKVKMLYLTAAVAKGSKTKIARRCVISNKNKIYSKEYPLGRHKMLELLKFGLLPGYKKAVW